jgi:hypothetical protein
VGMYSAVGAGRDTGRDNHALERVKYNASLIAAKSSKSDKIAYIIIKGLYAKIQMLFVINLALLRILLRNII